MPRLAFALLLASATAGGGGVAAGSDEAADWRKSPGVFCTALDRALKAAKEPMPFESLRVAGPNDPDRSRLTMPGFDSCHAWGDSLRCIRREAPPELTVANLAADTRRCVGVEPEEIEGFQVFELPGVAIQIENDCTDECQAGRTVNYRVETFGR